MSGIVLSPDELEALTGYQQATKQLNVLHTRGFLRAYICRRGDVVLERAHYEAVSRGEVIHVANGKPLVKSPKVANLSFLGRRAQDRHEKGEVVSTPAGSTPKVANLSFLPGAA